MNIQLLAFILLVGRLVSQFFICLVIKRQWQLRKLETHPRLMQMRRVLALLALAVFIGNLWPLALDLFTLFNPGVRTSPQVNIVGVLYSLDNSLTSMISSILIWTLYKLADVVIEVTEFLPKRKLK